MVLCRWLLNRGFGQLPEYLFPLVTTEASGQLLTECLQRLRGFCGDQHQLGRLLHPESLGLCGLVFLQYKMEIGAAEPEGTHARTTWNAVGDPRAGFTVEVERRVGNVELGVGLLQVDERGQHLVVQCKCHFDESGGSGGGLGVSDLRLDAAKRDRLCRHIGCRVNLAESLEFRDVPGSGASAVTLDEANTARLDSGILVGAAQAAGLSRGTGGVDAFETPVAGRTDALEHSVDLIPVALCVHESFEDDHTQAFADQDALGFGIEGTHTVILGERGRFAEAHVHERGVVRIDTTRDHHVCASIHKVVDRHLHRGK